MTVSMMPTVSTGLLVDLTSSSLVNVLITVFLFLIITL